MRLICTSPYRNRGVAYQVGELITLPDAEAQALMADSPGSFELAYPAPAAPAPPIADGAPANTAVRRAPKRKGA